MADVVSESNRFSIEVIVEEEPKAEETKSEETKTEEKLEEGKDDEISPEEKETEEKSEMNKAKEKPEETDAEEAESEETKVDEKSEESKAEEKSGETKAEEKLEETKDEKRSEKTKNKEKSVKTKAEEKSEEPKDEEKLEGTKADEKSEVPKTEWKKNAEDKVEKIEKLKIKDLKVDKIKPKKVVVKLPCDVCGREIAKEWMNRHKNSKSCVVRKTEDKIVLMKDVGEIEVIKDYEENDVMKDDDEEEVELKDYLEDEEIYVVGEQFSQEQRDTKETQKKKIKLDPGWMWNTCDLGALFLALDNDVSTSKGNTTETVKDILNKVIKDTVQISDKPETTKNTADQGLRTCHNCDERFHWVAELTIHMMNEHGMPRPLGDIDPLTAMFGEIMAELREEQEQMKLQNMKFQKDILKSFNSQNQVLTRDLTEGIMKMIRRENTDKLATKVYICEDCDFESVSKNELENHMHCQECAEYFSSMQDLSLHIQKNHELLSICDNVECRTSIKNKNKNIKNLEEVLNNRPAMKVDNDISKDHNEIMTVGIPNLVVAKEGCTKCDFKATSPSNLMAHAMTHTPPFMCEECQKEFTTMGGLVEHKKQKHVDISKQDDEREELKCKQCDVEFTTNAKLISHVKLKHDEDQYPCTRCKKWFKSLPELDSHIADVHDGTEITTVYKCDVCGINGSSLSQLQHHKEQKHRHIGDFKCQWCGMKANSEIQLITHAERCYHDQDFGLKFETIKKKECRHFKNGWCKKGVQCDFSHEVQQHAPVNQSKRECRDGNHCTYVRSMRGCRFFHPELGQDRNQEFRRPQDFRRQQEFRSQQEVQPRRQQEVQPRWQQEVPPRRQQKGISQPLARGQKLWCDYTMEQCPKVPVCPFQHYEDEYPALPVGGKKNEGWNKNEGWKKNEGWNKNEDWKKNKACNWQEDCERVPNCPYIHYAGDFPEAGRMENQQ